MHVLPCVCAGRFNERMVLSLASNPSCLLVDDELNILPTSSHVRNIEPLPADGDGPSQVSGTDTDLKGLSDSLADTLVTSFASSSCPLAVQTQALPSVISIGFSRHSVCFCQVSEAGQVQQHRSSQRACTAICRRCSAAVQPQLNSLRNCCDEMLHPRHMLCIRLLVIFVRQSQSQLDHHLYHPVCYSDLVFGMCSLLAL